MLELRPVPDDDAPSYRQRAADLAVRRRVRTQYAEEDTAREEAAEMMRQTDDCSRFFRVVDAPGDTEVGWVWWSTTGEKPSVNAVVLDDAERAVELIPAFVDQARDDGARSFGCSAVPGEETHQHLVTQPGFVPRATNMALALDGDLADRLDDRLGDPAPLELRPMTQAEFDAFLAVCVEGYIGELAASGMSPESARSRGEQQMAELIPSGLESEGQHFFTAWVGETPVGRLWLSTERRMAFVYDVDVEESQRRRGHGEAIMNAAARWSRDRGHPALGLNVFAHNPGARALYDKLGYRVTADYRTFDVPDAG